MQWRSVLFVERVSDIFVPESEILLKVALNKHHQIQPHLSPYIYIKLNYMGSLASSYEKIDI